MHEEAPDQQISRSETPRGGLKDPTLEPSNIGGWILRLFKGIAIGIGAILPGLSGGVLAVIFGIYEPMMSFLANLRERFWKRAMWFLPVAIGGGLGVLLFSFFVEQAFGQYEALFTSLFIGFVVGTLPSIYRTAGLEGRGTKEYSALGISTVVIFLLMVVVTGGTALTIAPSLPVWFLSGATVSLGMIVPGLSPSNFLMYFGLYETMAAHIAALNMRVIIPLIIGGIGIVLLLAKPVKILFERFYGVMYHLILGLVIGSSASVMATIVFPAFSEENLAVMGLSFNVALMLTIGLFIAGVILSYLFSRLETRVRPEG